MANIGFSDAVLEMGDVQAAARTLGLEVATVEIRRAEDIAPAFEALKGDADALYVCSDALVNTNRIRINTLALAARLPTMHGVREYVEAGRPDVLWSKLCSIASISPFKRASSAVLALSPWMKNSAGRQSGSSRP
jgi:hypothetical protein